MPSITTTRVGRAVGLAGVVLGLTVASAACSSGTTTTTGATTTTAASSATTRGTAGAGAGAGAGTTAAPTHRTVDANAASVAEIQAALEANGVPNAAKWAREVEEYRPYATDDPSFASLRKNLAKYNPSPEVLQQILASLTL